MPRDGSGIYTLPDPVVIENTTIESAVYNRFTGDVATEFNSARPIIAGGTGANNATQARQNLQVEASAIQVTNYNSHNFEGGSFWSIAGATGAPNGSDNFMGQSYIATNNMFLEARAIGTSPVPQPLWVKHKYNGVWGAWALASAEYDARYVNVTGDTMTGNLTVNGDFAANTVTSTAGMLANTGNIIAQTGNLWAPNGLLVAGPYALTIGGTGGNPANGMGYDGTSMALRTSATGGIYLQAQAGSATFASFLAATTTLQSTATIVSGTLAVNGNATLSAALTVTGDTTKNGNLALTKASPTININATSGMPVVNYLISGGVVSSVYDNGSGIIIASNGALTAGNYMVRGASTWTALSDARLPEKVGAKTLNMLERIDKIQVYENTFDGRLTLFVIAQEFVNCLPHLVKVGSTDTRHIPTGLNDPDAWGVSYDRAGVAALQLGKEIYAALLQQIAALTARVEALEAAQATP